MSTNTNGSRIFRGTILAAVGILVGAVTPLLAAQPAAAVGTAITLSTCSASELATDMTNAQTDAQPVAITLASGCNGASSYNAPGPGYTAGAVGTDAFTPVKAGETLTINGQGDTLTTAQAFRFFEVQSGGSLTLQNLTITGGDDVSGHGGGAVWNAGSLTAQSVTFSNDTTTTHGGAIDSGDDLTGTVTTTVTGSTFSNDSASSGTVGAVTVDGGAIDNGDDDALGNGSGTGTLTVTDSTFDADSATASGACTAAGPCPSADGGAIANAPGNGHGTTAITGSFFDADAVSADGAGNGAGLFPQAGGGAVGNADGGDNGTLTVTTSTFESNGVTSTHGTADGGAIDSGDYDGTTAPLAVTVSTFYSNSAQSDGGAIGLYGSGEVVASTFDANTATVAGKGNTLLTNAGSSPPQTLAADLIVSAAPACDTTGGAATDEGYNMESDATNSCGFTTLTSKFNVSGLASGLQAPPANNGGPTRTMALSSSDPAASDIPSVTANAAGPASYPDLCGRTDQTGFTSPSGAACAVGAYEPRPAAPPPPPTPDVVLTESLATLTEGGEAAEVFTATVSGTSGTPTGTVVVVAGSAVPCTVTLSGGTGSCSPTDGSVLAPGAYQVIGDYSGNGTYAGAVSRPVDLTVTAPAPLPGPGCNEDGYRLADRLGGVYSYGDAAFFGSLRAGADGLSLTPASPVVGIAPTPDCDGYWLAGADGGVFAFGDAHFDESLPRGPGGLSVAPASPITGIVATGDGRGYWLVGADGGVFAFGDALFDESLPPGPGGIDQAPSAPIVGIAGTPDRLGYWLVGRDGSVYALGDAPYLGGPNTLPGGPGTSIASIAATPDGRGYWVIGTDGAVFAYGDAPYLGSDTTFAGGTVPMLDTVGIVSSPDGAGYWEVLNDGAVFGFGDASYFGGANSLNGGAGPVQPVVGASH